MNRNIFLPSWDGDCDCPKCGSFALSYGYPVGKSESGKWLYCTKICCETCGLSEEKDEREILEN